MDSRVAQWGNSLAIRIPRLVARQLGLVEGQSVVLDVKEGVLTLRPVAPAKITLEELLAGVTEDNLHGETDWGDPVGREEW
jgi:antitoxin MazE